MKVSANFPTLPPGTILQNMYLKERLAVRRPGTFIEVGTGNGRISKICLDAGWSGCGYDLSPAALDQAKMLNESYIWAGLFKLYCQDWLQAPQSAPVDMVVSSLVLEHLPDNLVDVYFQRCRQSLVSTGTISLFVPGSPQHWGIEDEIAGHHRRYTQESLIRKLVENSFHVTHMAGLTFPLSNLLLPLSNYLVGRGEQQKLLVSMLERTRQSGNRQVLGKTTFSPFLGVVLNEVTMLPFHIMQKAFRRHEDSMILYAEATPIG